MSRKLTVLVLVLALLLSVTITCSAAARSTWAVTDLVFEGTTAICEVTANTELVTQRISARVALYQGKTCIASWYQAAYGILDFSETATVEKGKEYVMLVDLTVNGVVQPTLRQAGTCE